MMISFYFVFATSVFASLVASAQACPALCTCKDASVRCLDPTLNSFPSPLPAGTEILQIKGTHSQRSSLQRLSKSDLAGLTSLKTLIISNTLLDSIEAGTFEGLNRLLTLDLSFNQLTTLPAGVFDKLSGLAMLHLTGNEHLHLGPGVFKDLRNLLELYLGDLALGSLDLRIFSGLDSLLSLELSGNDLTSVPSGVADPTFLRSLTNLDLTYNQLSYLSNDTAPLLRRVSHVWLANNPWLCNCEIKWLQENFRRHVFPSHMSNQVALCEGPEGVANMALGLLRPDQFVCVAPQIVHCDPIDPQTVGATFHIRCNLTGQPFPFVSWKTPDGATTIGSSRHQVSPQLDLQPPKVTIRLMAGTTTNGSLTVLAQNVYGVGTEKINVLVKPLPTTTAGPATTTDRTRPTPDQTTSTTKEEAGDTTGGDGGKTDGKKESDGNSGMMFLYIAAAVGGASLLLSATMLGVACRKLNKAKVTPLQEDRTKEKNNNNNPRKRRENRDDEYGHGDNGVDEMNYDRGNPNGDGGGGWERPPTAGRPMSAWDI